MASNSSPRSREADQTAQHHRHIQADIDQKDEARQGEQPDEQAVQAGVREYPSSFPKQYHSKPGHEAKLDPQPMYDAPGYKGSEKLQDMVAIVTGADSGIGRAVAVLYAREGADVAIVYLNEHEDAEETKRAVEKEGRRAILLSGDIRKQEFCREAVEKTLQEFGKLDILVNNAGFQLHSSKLEDVTEDNLDMHMKTNLYGTFFMTQAAVPHLKKGSSIIVTGSVTGLVGNGELPIYATTKGGLHMFARSLSENLVQKGIRVNAVAPGPVWTPLNPSDSPDIESFGKSTPMKRAAQPEEIAPAYVFLAAPCCSSYITGEILPIIGGYQGA
ncbi:MAG TPA: SDR family oxidoreductase [Gammaproteobacteria bacterium]|nr:SDR family oxidoreductase [Gammaproteobacteria bacterium]